jgi:hypothetical protein
VVRPDRDFPTPLHSFINLDLRAYWGRSRSRRKLPAQPVHLARPSQSLAAAVVRPDRSEIAISISPPPIAFLLFDLDNLDLRAEGLYLGPEPEPEAAAGPARPLRPP